MAKRMVSESSESMPASARGVSSASLSSGSCFSWRTMSVSFCAISSRVMGGYDTNGVRGHRWLLYPAWMVICAALAFALRNAEDPSRRGGRILSNDAAVRAVAILHQVDRVKYRDYDAVHVAWETNRWIVL